MATADFLFGGSTPSSSTQQSTTVQNMPDWFQETVKGLLSRGSAIAGAPYQAYSGPRVAEFNADQQQAFDRARNMQGQGTGMIQQGADLVNQGTGGFNQQSFDSY